jgi:hypothetical protein
MGLADIEAEIVEGLPWRKCAVCFHMDERGEEWAASLTRLLANRGVKFRDLADLLEADPDEPTIDRQALSRHARGECAAKSKVRQT